MPNSYGFSGDIPDWAKFGVYDTENGEWTGTFFRTEAEAQKVADALADDGSECGVVSVDGQDWL